MEVMPKDIADLHPLINIKDVHMAVYSPGDGIMDPSTLCMSYVKAAVKSGAKVNEFTTNSIKKLHCSMFIFKIFSQKHSHSLLKLVVLLCKRTH